MLTYWIEVIFEGTLQNSFEKRPSPLHHHKNLTIAQVLWGGRWWLREREWVWSKGYRPYKDFGPLTWPGFHQLDLSSVFMPSSIQALSGRMESNTGPAAATNVAHEPRIKWREMVRWERLLVLCSYVRLPWGTTACTYGYDGERARSAHKEGDSSRCSRWHAAALATLCWWARWSSSWAARLASSTR